MLPCEAAASGNLLVAQWLLFGVFTIAGAAALLAALFDSDWLFTSSSARTLSRSRRRARLFYGICGAAILAAAWMALLPE